jgi:hypothetical protein
VPRIRKGPLSKENLLADPAIRRWYNNLQRGSHSTADVYLRRLAVLCQKMGTTPQGLASMAKSGVDDFVMDFVTEEEKVNAAGSYVKHSVVVLRSWLAHNGMQITKRVKIRGANRTPRIENESVPTQEELHRVFMHCTSQSRVAAVLMAHAGLRPQVIGNYLGNDGLRLKDLPDLVVDPKAGTVEFREIPARIIVRPELSKAGHTYFTFLGEEGCEYVAQYLRGRLQHGEELTPESDLVTPMKRALRGSSLGKEFIRATNIGDIIRTGIRGAELTVRPYALRAYFDTQLLLAESKGKVAHDYRVFWMGHKGSMEARYTTNKGRLTQEMLQDMREAYGRCSKFLSTVPTQDDTQGAVNATRVLLLGLKYTEEELAELDLENLTTEALQELVSKKLVPPTVAPPPTPATSAPSRKHKVVSAREVAKYLEDGWVPVMKLSEKEVVLSPPAV